MSIAAALVVFLLVAAAGAGLWFLSSRIAPDVEIGQPLPPIRLVSFDGTPVDLESYRGRVVVLDLWASW